jgi:hypothetical protein
LRRTALLTAAIAAVVTAAAAGLQAQRGTAPSATGRYVAIGCISRDTSSTPPGFILTDMRGTSPEVYRLNGDEKLLTFHVGHTVEISGTLSAGSNAASGANAVAFVMKIDQLTYISTSCVKIGGR